MTHIKRQKLISLTQLREYNTQFLLYPQAYSFFLHLYLQFFYNILCYFL